MVEFFVAFNTNIGSWIEEEHSAFGIDGGEHLRLCRNIRKKETSQSSPNTDRVEKMVGDAFK